MHIRPPPRSFLKNKIKLKYKIKNNDSGQSLPSPFPPLAPPPSGKGQRQDPPAPTAGPGGLSPGAAGGDCGGRWCCQTLWLVLLLVGRGQAGGPRSPPHTFSFPHDPSIFLFPPLYSSPSVFSSFFFFFFLMEKNMNRLFVCLFFPDVVTSTSRRQQIVFNKDSDIKIQI